ncbi:hypothetical protein, conserved [Babesia ovata]|uniref:Uncharacterized protein n=1 Tax=Babesia ovata TaxID=189622 RepID=A0A2H6KAY7_9APIC|nr:uncharacterized protein BOVATA_016500 [Babesia ovata]GBE60157.1 hypothetical protein, conserved [Babesia ovata]
MVYTSLTEAPRNLKEGIDWLIALKGTSKFNMQVLGHAIYNFLVDKPVGTLLIPSLENVKRLSKEFLEQNELKDLPYVEDLLSKFQKSMHIKSSGAATPSGLAPKSDYENIVQAKGIKPEEIAKNVGTVVDACEKFLDDIKNPYLYKSSYSPEATWDASCAKNPETCAVILVGIAPMLYVGLHSLSDANSPALLGRRLPNSRNRLGVLLTAAGYKRPHCRAGMKVSDVREALQSVSSKMLVTLYDLAGFWAFY